MRCKKIFIFTVLLLFLALQVAPLAAKNQPQSSTQGVVPIIDDPNSDPNGGGEEHPWEDNDDDGGIGVSDGKSAFDNLISQFINLFKGEQKQIKPKSVEKKDVNLKKVKKTPFRKFK